MTARIPVPSRLNIPTWRFFLRDYQYFLEYGWPIGYVRNILPLFNLRTHRGTLDYPDSVSQYLISELQLGRVAVPFRSVPFVDGSVTSPLNTVEKRVSSERRVIVDLSWPRGSSVNDDILSDSFLGVPIDLHYPTIGSIADAIVATGWGCLLYKRDFKEAYRQFPVDPGDYYLLGYVWENNFHFDTVLTMGLRWTAMACQQAATAVSWICYQWGHSVFNYLDDFIGVAPPPPPFDCTTFNELGDLLLSLGLEESTEKASPPSTRMVCLGVELDTLALTLLVSRERLAEIGCLLAHWRTKT